MTEQVLQILLYGITLLCIGFFVWNLWLTQKIKKLTRGGSFDNLDQVLKSIDNDMVSMQNFSKQTIDKMKNFEERIKISQSNLDITHYKAFSGMDSGGNTSFALTILNEKGDGFILSSMQARERMSLFCKPVKNFRTEGILTEEEKSSLTKAINSCKL